MNDFQKKIYEAIGEASMCWKETPKGVFDDVKAKAIGDKLCEIYRLQMAGISTAAIGYYKESESIHPDYDTVALHDVAKLYEKYDVLYQKFQGQVAVEPEKPYSINNGTDTKHYG